MMKHDEGAWRALSLSARSDIMRSATSRKEKFAQGCTAIFRLAFVTYCLRKICSIGEEWTILAASIVCKIRTFVEKPNEKGKHKISKSCITRGDGGRWPYWRTDFPSGNVFNFRYFYWTKGANESGWVERESNFSFVFTSDKAHSAVHPEGNIRPTIACAWLWERNVQMALISVKGLSSKCVYLFSISFSSFYSLSRALSYYFSVLFKFSFINDIKRRN